MTLTVLKQIAVMNQKYYEEHCLELPTFIPPPPQLQIHKGIGATTHTFFSKATFEKFSRNSITTTCDKY